MDSNTGPPAGGVSGGEGEPDGNDPLRARVAELEEQLRQARLAGPGGPGGRHEPQHRGAWSVVSGVLLVLAGLLAPLSVVAVWANTQLLDTDQYVRTVAPLAHDAGVQAAVAAEVTSAILDAIDAQEVTADVLGSIAERPNVPPRVAAALPSLVGPINGAVEDFVSDEVDQFVASDRFAQLWSTANRVAHHKVVRLLAGDAGSGVVTAQDDAVTLNLAPIVAEVKQALVDRGFGLASAIPEVDRSFVIIQSSAVTTTQDAYRWLSVAGLWLPVATLLLFGLGVLAAGDRRRAVLHGALGVVATMLLAGVALALFRGIYVTSTRADVLDPAVASTVFDTLVRSLRSGIRVVAVLGLVVAAVAYLLGPSAPARGSRSVLASILERVRGGSGSWFQAHRNVLRALLLIVGGLVVLFWPSPTVWVVLAVAAVVALALAVVGMLAQPPVVAVSPTESPVA